MEVGLGADVGSKLFEEACDVHAEVDSDRCSSPGTLGTELCATVRKYQAELAEKQ